MGFGSWVSDFVSNPIGTIGDAGQSVVDKVGQAGVGIDQTVRDNVPGGWKIPAIAAAAYLTGGASLAATGAGASEASFVAADAAQLAAQGLSSAQIESTLISGGADAFMAADAAQLAAQGIKGDQLTSLLGQSSGAGAAGISGLSNAANALKSVSGNQQSGLTGAGALAGIGGLAGALALINADKGKYGVPGQQAYTGPMNQFKYSPSAFTPTRVDPNMFKPQGAPTAQVGYGAPQGGLAGLQQQSQTPYMQQLMGMRAQQGRGNPQAYMRNDVNSQRSDVNGTPMDTMPSNYGYAGGGQIAFAQGGSSDLGGYSDGGRMLKGPGDGMSDSIPASISGKQPARLADSEFVIPADVVSHLGNGSSDAGAKVLYKMMDRVRQARTGNKEQGKQINPSKFMPK